MLNDHVFYLLRDLSLDNPRLSFEGIEVSEDLRLKDLTKRLKPKARHMLVWKNDREKKAYITVVYWVIGDEYSDVEEWLVFQNPLPNLFNDPCLCKNVAERGLNLHLSELFSERLSFYHIYDYDI